MKAHTDYSTGTGTGENSDAIRSNIAQTREKMDQTLDELGQRMTPRHLLDDLLDFLRTRSPDRETIKARAGAAAGRAGDALSHVTSAVADAVRQHPVPTLLIGAGIAWAIYENRRGNGGDYYYDVEEDWEREGMGEGTAAGFEASGEAGPSAKEKIREKMSAAGQKWEEKTQHLRERAAEGGRVIRIKASELKRRLSERAERGYTAGREKLRETTETHPLTTGLGFFAMGVLGALALPHTRAEEEWVGGASRRVRDRLRERGRDYMERGKQVISSASDAAREEAARQGLTPEALKAKAAQVAESTKGAAERSLEEQRRAKSSSPTTQPGQPPESESTPPLA
jgi:hypothetical protein